MIDLCCATLQNPRAECPFFPRPASRIGKVDIWSRYWGIVRTSRGVSAPSRARDWRKPAGLWRDLPRPRCGFQPHGHPRLKRGGIVSRIGADHKRVEIVVADGAGRAPGREL